MNSTKIRAVEQILLGATAVSLFFGVPPVSAQLGPNYGACANLKGNAEQAIAACSALIGSGRDQGRNLATSYYNRGMGWARRNELDRAIADFAQAIHTLPGYAKAYDERGAVFGRKNQFDLALADFSKAIELDPKLASAFGNRALTYLKMSDPDRAIGDAARAIALDANYARAYTTRGGAYAQKGNLDSALADLNTAIRLDPSLPAAYSNRGLVYMKRGEKDRALLDFNESTRLDPTVAAAFNNRALLRKEKRDFVGALADLEKAIRINPSYALAYVNRGRVYEEYGDRTMALADFNSALALEPGRADALAGRTRLGVTSTGARTAKQGRSRTPISAPSASETVARTAPVSPTPATQAPGSAPAPAGSGSQAAAQPARLPPGVLQDQASLAGQTTSAATGTVGPIRDFTEALAACSRAAENVALPSVAAPGANAKSAIPSCYRGRQHLECTMKALLDEAATIEREYGEIVRENYPDRKDVKAICSIPGKRLAEHLVRSKTIDMRANKVQQVFQSNATCIESVRVALGEINLGSMQDPGALMSSLLQEVGRPIAQASASQSEVLRLVGQIEGSRKAIATVQELRQIVCP